MAIDHILPAGTTGQLIEFLLRDATTGLPAAGVTATSVSWSYMREGAGAIGANGTCVVADAVGAINKDNSLVPVGVAASGLYQYKVPDAALAAGAKAVTLYFSGASIMTRPYRILLTDPVRGLGSPTALPAIGSVATHDQATDIYEWVSETLPAIIDDIPQPVIGPFPAALTQPGQEPVDIVLAQGSVFLAPNGGSISWTITDATGTAVSFAGKAISLVIAAKHGDTAIATYTSGAGAISIGGTGNNLISVSGDTAATGQSRRLVYELWNTTDGVEIIRGQIRVQPATQA